MSIKQALAERSRAGDSGSGRNRPIHTHHDTCDEKADYAVTSRLPWPESDHETDADSAEPPIVIVGLAAPEGAPEAVRRAEGAGPVGVRVRCAPDGVAAFFGDSVLGASRERLSALHLVWAALEDAGIVPGSLRDADVGVFLVRAEAGEGDGSAGGPDALAALVGGDLHWGRGPRVTLGAELPARAAVESAAERLRREECDVAVAGSVTGAVAVLRRGSTAVRAGERVLAPAEAFGSDEPLGLGGAAAPSAARLVPLVLSGRSDAAVAALARDLLARFEGDPDLSPADLGWSLAATRTTGLGRRAVLLATDRAEVVRGLRAVAEGGFAPLLFRTAPGAGVAGGGTAVQVFPGLGSQWRGMALDLLDASDVFRARMEDCARALEPLVPWSLHDVLRGEPDAPSLEDVDVVLPVLFAVSVSLSALWSSCGVEPAVAVGASLGEIAAAHVAGALTLDEAARVAVLWSRMQAEAAGEGELAAAALPPDELRPLLDAERLRGRVHFAGTNGPRSVLFGGEHAAVTEVVEMLAAKGVPAKKLDLGLAAHTPGLTVDSTAFLTGTAAITPAPATVPFYSSLTGGEFETTGLDGAYWLRNLTSEVRFETAVRALWAAGHHTFLEVSPHPVLLGGVQETLEEIGAGSGAASSVVGTLRRGEDGVTAWLTAMAQLYVRGIAVDWAAFFRGRDGRRIALPTYPFGVEGTAMAEGAGATGGAPAQGAGTGGPSLAGLTAGERSYAVEELVRAQVAMVLRHNDPGAVPLERGFLQSGFDSLRAVELRNRLGEATGLRLPTTLIFDHPTPASVADLIGALLAVRTEQAGRGADQGAASAVLAQVDALEAELLASGLLHDGDDGPGSAPARDRVAARLRDLLDRLTPDDEEEFGDVSLEELLDLAENELRKS
ncbi:acyltransferase domain-containing protein [Streptomyces sp. DSM 40750]|uniref:acyltransferase domain-containing protein n=1 Tax=Streptomyces sp. DSM 40750 TaxID=2801030 RepID=UPI00214C7E8E|nr:acyltransferase domain-containing protein [Streptomyces sp. DSM 40750]UUU26925.1 acyltransferase domain-containing protein [Streptomyces sp. DSM 40750]